MWSCKFEFWGIQFCFFKKGTFHTKVKNIYTYCIQKALDTFIYL